MYYSFLLCLLRIENVLSVSEILIIVTQGSMYLKSFLVDRSDSQTLQKFAKRGKGMKRRFTWRVVTTSYTGVHLINRRILINISLNTIWFYISITHQKKILFINSARRGAFYHLDNLHSQSCINWSERKHLNVIV